MQLHSDRLQRLFGSDYEQRAWELSAKYEYDPQLRQKVFEALRETFADVERIKVRIQRDDE